LSPDKLALFTRAAERSLARAQALERRPDQSFEDYLAGYFGSILGAERAIL
jgi:hypothetical protein